MEMKVAILAVVYYEPSWTNTVVSLARVDGGAPLFLVDRSGVGGLSWALNTGFTRYSLRDYQYVWMVTNIEFGPSLLPELVRALDDLPDYAAITPTFPSDHAHTRPKGGHGVESTPFLEFTAPLVRSKAFQEHRLDEQMPYSGHDLDWGYRVRHAGWKVGVYHDATIRHVYIRHADKSHPITQERLRLRMAAEEPTKRLLGRKYGGDWFKKLRYNY
jgi:hypothetical protein